MYWVPGMGHRCASPSPWAVADVVEPCLVLGSVNLHWPNTPREGHDVVAGQDQDHQLPVRVSQKSKRGECWNLILREVL